MARVSECERCYGDRLSTNLEYLDGRIPMKLLIRLTLLTVVAVGVINAILDFIRYMKIRAMSTQPALFVPFNEGF